MPIYAAFIVVVAVWSTTPLAVKLSTDAHISFIEGVGLRMIAGALLASLLLRLMRIERRYDWPAQRIFLAGALGFFGAMTQVYWAAQFIPSGLIAIIFGVAPLFAGVLGALVLGERSLTPLRVVALLAALLGLFLIFQGEVKVEPEAAPAIAVLVFATLIYALSSVLVKKYQTPLHPLAQVSGSLWYSCIGYALVWLAVDGSPPGDIEPVTLAVISYLAIFGSVIGFMLYFRLLAHLPVTTVALITLITPPCALVIGWLVADEELTRQTLIGGAIVLMALAVYQWAGPPQANMRASRR